MKLVNLLGSLPADTHTHTHTRTHAHARTHKEVEIKNKKRERTLSFWARSKCNYNSVDP